MACRLYGTQSLSQPLQEYYQLDAYEQISMKFESKYNNLNSENSSSHFFLGLNVLNSVPDHTKSHDTTGVK